jgi:hypothetical protein
MKTSFVALTLSAGLFLLFPASDCPAQVPLLSQDFAAASPGSYVKNSTIGTESGSILLVIQPPQQIKVETQSGGANAMLFIDADRDKSSLVLARFGLSTKDKDLSAIQGSFVFTPLNATGSATGSDNPDMAFAINQKNSLFTSEENSGIDLIFANGNKVTYYDANGQSDTLCMLEYGVTYRLNLRANFAQNTYTFSIVKVDGGVVVYSSPVVKMRVQNIAPDSILFTAGNNAKWGSENPFWKLEKIEFSTLNPSR